MQNCWRWSFLGAAIMLGGCQVSEDQLEQYIKSQGFTVLNPPTSLYVPGSLVYRSNYDPQDIHPTKVTLGFLCRPEYSVGLYNKNPIASATLQSATVTQFGGSISAGIPALSRLVNLNAKAKVASSISADIHDVTVKVFALDDLQAIRDQLGPNCRRIVNGNVPSNAYQVIEVLQASIDVTVQISGDVDANAKANFLSQLANLGFTASGSETESLKGTALLFGVQLMPITTPLPSEGAAPAIASVGASSDGASIASRRPAASARKRSLAQSSPN